MCLSIPEAINNLVSCFSNKQELIGFGFGMIIGSGIFDFTFAFGVSAFTSYIYHQEEVQLKAAKIIKLPIFYFFNIALLTYITSLDLVKIYYLTGVIFLLPVTYMLFIESVAIESQKDSEDEDELFQRAFNHRL
jgi:Ca2+/Na+ antiporter